MNLESYIIDWVLSKLTFPYNLLAVIFILCSFFLFAFIYKYHKKTADKIINSNKKNIIIIIIVILVADITAMPLYFVYDNWIFPNPPEDRFRVAISPFYLEDSDEVDLTTAEALKNKIENTTEDRIEVMILNTSPIKDKENAIQKGKKSGAHLAVYGGEKRILGHGTQIEFYVVPTNTETVIPEIYFGNNKNVEFKETLYKYYDKPIVIVESLEENVSSAVYAICAFEYYERSEYDSALKIFKDIKNYENDGSILFYVATCYLSEGELNESLVYFNKAIEINPHFSIAWYNKGYALSELGKNEEAVEAYDKAIEINPLFSLAWNNKGNIFYELGNYEEAIKAFDKAIEFNPQSSDALYNKGNALCFLGRYEEGIEAYDKAIEINPYSSGRYNRRIFLYEWGNYEEEKGNYNKAIEVYDKAIEIDPQYPAGWYNKGNVLTQLGNYKEAIEAYDKAIEIDPQYSEAWYNRARVYSLKKNKEKAIFSLKSAIELNSSYKEIAKNDEAYNELRADEDFKKLTE